VKGYLVEIQPNECKKTIRLGTYKTAHEAARAYDAGIFYTGKTIDLNFHDSVTSFVAIPPVSLEDSRKSESSMNEFKAFIKEQAAKAARRALDDPEWKRTYDEWCLQVMWFSVCRIFWL
jgi:Tfp pilus assembly protein PilV